MATIDTFPPCLTLVGLIIRKPFEPNKIYIHMAKDNRGVYACVSASDASLGVRQRF